MATTSDKFHPLLTKVLAFIVKKMSNGQLKWTECLLMASGRHKKDVDFIIQKLSFCWMIRSPGKTVWYPRQSTFSEYSSWSFAQKLVYFDYDSYGSWDVTTFMISIFLMLQFHSLECSLTLLLKEEQVLRGTIVLQPLPSWTQNKMRLPPNLFQKF